ncbi:hypothetical protein [Candidatus Accumulibacter sp. ACC005]|nr:hypothetical protein [Candidatus Accumulibacter sp. ACC005]
MSASQLPRPLVGWPLFALPDERGQLDWPDLSKPACARESA